MRVLLLSWEYPPLVHGGLGRHVHALSLALRRAGHEVHVLTRHRADLPVEELVDGVHVVRAPEPPPRTDPADWVAGVLSVNAGLQTAGLRLLAETPIDVVHAHDWLVGYAAGGIKAVEDVPLVATIHATEFGRHQGWLPGPMNRFIHQVEWWLTYEARRVITCSRYMHDQARRIFELPSQKMHCIPNGVSTEEFRLVAADEVEALRDRLAPGGEALVLFAGRLEYEKGVQTLLRAVRGLKDSGLPVRLIVAGDGTYRGALEEQARKLRLVRPVTFTGFLDRAELVARYRAADVAVVPSIYEPFGIVALEAMAAGTPLIVSATGGLAELVDDGATGLCVPPEDVGALGDALRRVLEEPAFGQALALRAHARLEAAYSWDAVARRTVTAYERARREERLLARPHLPLRVPIPHWP